MKTGYVSQRCDQLDKVVRLALLAKYLEINPATVALIGRSKG
jgi:hypothetical protein